jgi:hypothetical protein
MTQTSLLDDVTGQDVGHQYCAPVIMTINKKADLSVQKKWIPGQLWLRLIPVAIMGHQVTVIRL